MIMVTMIGVSLFTLVAFFAPVSAAETLTITQKNSGKILLQVESRGEAWYVNPKDLKKYSLGKPADAFAIIKKLGIGISNVNTSSHGTAIYYYPEACSGWKSLSPKYLMAFDSLDALLMAYPSRTKSPQCE